MKMLLYAISMQCLLAFSTYAEIVFDPHEIKLENKIKLNNIVYQQYEHDSTVIFKIQESISPVFNRILLMARKLKRNIVLNNESIIYFDDADSLLREITMQPSFRYVLINPKTIKFKKNYSYIDGKDKYYIQSYKNKYEVPREDYQKLKKLVNIAWFKNQVIVMDTYDINRKNYSHFSIFSDERGNIFAPHKITKGKKHRNNDYIEFFYEGYAIFRIHVDILEAFERYLYIAKEKYNDIYLEDRVSFNFNSMETIRSTFYLQQSQRYLFVNPNSISTKQKWMGFKTAYAKLPVGIKFMVYNREIFESLNTQISIASTEGKLLLIEINDFVAEDCARGDCFTVTPYVF